jgi:DNA-binding MarR family transcriptional regulator
MQKNAAENSRIILDLLESVSRDGGHSQRTRASEFGVALGLVNAYLNYCVKKGYIRVKKIPAKRYFYYLTPKGFAEKSRLALVLVSNSFRSFRQAREEYGAAFAAFRRAGCRRIVLIGRSELAEIATLCAAENDITIAAILSDTEGLFLGLPMVKAFEQVPDGFDGFAITDLNNPTAAYDAAVRMLGRERVAAPSFLRITQHGQAAE